jgi:hypothetical protein
MSMRFAGGVSAGANAGTKKDGSSGMVGIQKTRLSNDGFPDFDWVPAELSKNVGPFDPSRMKETVGSFGPKAFACRNAFEYEAPEQHNPLAHFPWEQAFREHDQVVQVVNNYYVLNKDDSRELRKFLSQLAEDEMQATSVRRKRKLKMNRHKVKKRRRATRTARKLLRQ